MNERINKMLEQSNIDQYHDLKASTARDLILQARQGDFDSILDAIYTAYKLGHIMGRKQEQAEARKKKAAAQA